MKDGIYPNMPMAEYLAIGRPTLDLETGELVQAEDGYCISSGIVKELYWHSEFHALQKLTGELHKDSSARQKLGSLTHTAVLEPLLLDESYVVMPVPDPKKFLKADGTEPSLPNVKRTKDYQAAVVALKEANPDKVAVEYEDIVAAHAVMEGVARCEDAAFLVGAPGQIELTVIATDPETGLRMKARFDKWMEVGWDLNLKGCRSAKFHKFQRDVSNMHFIGAGFYKHVAELAGLEFKRSIILALELDAPHVAKPWEMYPDVIDGGERVTRWGLDKLAIAIEKDEWPAYGNQIEGMALTEYAYAGIDERTAE